MGNAGDSLGVDAATRVASPHARIVEDGPPTMAAALDQASVRWLRVFHAFGIVAPLLTLLLSFLLGGDPVLRAWFRAGMGVLALSNVFMLILLRRTSEETPVAVALWAACGFGCMPAVLYFGPYSGVVVILMIAITIVAIGTRGRVAAAVLSTSLVSHLCMTIPMILGWTRDRGLLSSDGLDGATRITTELLLVSLLVSGYGIGRWVRTTSADGLRELEKARRELGDQKQALEEIDLDVARAKLWNEGRWTGHTFGGWRLGVVLGRGAMGEVYEATARDGRLGALKLLAPHGDVADWLLERFHRELEVVARLDSEFIVRVLEISPPDADVPYLVMERLRGHDLATELRRVKRLPLDAVIAMLQQVARGLEVARLANVVHRDLKPHNLFCHDGQWKILDFGVAKLIGSEGTLTGNAIVGTPQYMAPEQATNRSSTTVTHRADVYALGAIAYRCLTGRAPFSASDIAAVLLQVITDAPPRPSAFATIPRSVEDVLAVAMAKDPNQRFETGLVFAEHLATAARMPVALAVPPNAWQHG